MSNQDAVNTLRQAAERHQRGDLAEARRLYSLVLRREPGNAEALHLAGVAEAQSGSAETGLTLLDRAVLADARNPVIRVNQSLVFSSLGRMTEALGSADAACLVAPTFAPAHATRGDLLHSSGRFDEAAASFARAAALTPEDGSLQVRLGNSLAMLGRFEEALSAFSRAARLDPGDPHAHMQQGICLLLLHRHEAALRCLDHAVGLAPDFADAHNARAVVLLTLGDYRRGLPELEWRWTAASTSSSRERREYRQPRWTGREPLAGKRILLYNEQGLGDTLQFCRYVDLVASKGATVILQAQRPLMKLLQQLSGASQVVADDEAPPEFDLHCALMSLPLAFETSVESVPAPVPYLQADPARVAAWQQRLGPRNHPRVGLMWSGNPENLQDRYRSFPLAEWLPHLPQGFEYFSLQRFVRDEDCAALNGGVVRDLSAEQHEFDDAAALCACMDLVISVCTSVAHLSGAMGRPTWILLARQADWRWLLHRGDSPWYPTARLYRQDSAGDWSHVFSRVASDLAREIKLKT